MTVRGVGEAGGKAILLGEHTVVHGTAAVAVPVSELGVRVELTTGSGWDIEADADLETLDRARAAVLDCLSWEGPPPAVRVRATLPPSCGLGSSAAFSVALARAALDARGATGGVAEVRSLADEAERVFHGNPSGVDVATVAAGRAIRFRRGEAPVPVDIGGRIHLWIVDTAVRSLTSEAVADVARLARRQPDAVRGICARAEDTVTRGVEALERGDARALGDAMEDAMAALRELDVSHPRIEAAIEDAVARGALAGKLSGAGRGGVVLVLAPDAAWEPGGSLGGCRVLSRLTLEPNL